jgi:hypothetical protein
MIINSHKLPKELVEAIQKKPFNVMLVLGNSKKKKIVTVIPSLGN